MSVAPTGSFHRLGHSHAKVQHVADHLQVGLHLGVRAGGAANQLQLRATMVCLSKDHYRVHGMTDPLAGLQTVHVILFQVPVGHPVVQQDSRIAGDEAGPPRALYALQLAHGIAPTVHHRKAGGVLFFTCHTGMGRGRPAALLGHLVSPGVTSTDFPGGSLWIDLPGPFGSVILGKQPLSGDIDVVWVGHVGFPVGEGQLLGLHHQVNAVGGVAAQALKVELLHQVKFLQQDMAAGVGGRFIDRAASVCGGYGVLPPRAAVRQVLQGQQPALFLGKLDDGLGYFALIESVPATVNDCLEGAGQVLLV